MKIVNINNIDNIIQQLEEQKFPWMVSDYSVKSLPKKSKKRLRKCINKIHRGNCYDIMKKIPSNSIDAIATDPPSGIGFLNKKWDTFNKIKSGFVGNNKKSKSKGQPKKARDNFILYISVIMKEVYRILKPGALGVVWALPRTSYWTAMALDEAGFEIRDQIYHLFGSGFPKSLNIGLNFDRKACYRKIKKKLGRKPTQKEFKKAWKKFRKIILETTTKSGGMKNVNKIAKEQGYRPKNYNEEGNTFTVSEPTTEAAKFWDGWGTGLKPAVECWWLIRKPINDGIVENVNKFGTGGININKCRIKTKEDLGRKNSEEKYGFCGQGTAGKGKGSFYGLPIEKQGRWPSHLIHDGSNEVIRHFPTTTQPSNRNRKKYVYTEGVFPNIGRGGTVGHNDIGSVSRFFYCAKPSPSEKNEGCSSLPKKERIRQGLAGEHKNTLLKNFHPTVKSTSLMKYLLRLITPPGGIVLDPFAGSGTTLVASILEGHNFIGMEKNKQYYKISKNRIENAKNKFLRKIKKERSKEWWKKI